MAKDNRKTETHERILESAFDEFARHGFAETSMGTIARHARVAHGTVFSHFGRKADVFAAVVRLAGERFVQSFNEIHEDGASFLETATTWVGHLQSDSPFSRLLRSLGGDHPHRAVEAASDAVNVLFMAFWREWLYAYGRRHSRESIGDPARVARTVVAALAGLATIKIEPPDDALRSLSTLAQLVEQT